MAPDETHAPAFHIRLTLLIVGLLLISASAQAVEWKSLTSFRQARRLRVIDDTVYVVSSGGILAVADPGRPGIEFNNLSSLGTTDVTDVIKDAAGQKWVTAFGNLIRFGGRSSERFPMFDNLNNRFGLNSLVDDGDNLWLAAELGLILFSKVEDGGQIQDSYQLFGDLNSAPAVFDVALGGDTIFVATDNGFAFADRTDPNLLKGKSFWTSVGIGSHPQIGTDTVRAVEVFEDVLYVGTANGLFSYDPELDSLFQFSFGAGANVFDLNIERDTLFVFLHAGMAYVKDSNLVVLSTAGLPSASIMSGATTTTARWVGLSQSGIYTEVGAQFSEYSFTGLPVNDVGGVTLGTGRPLTIFSGALGPFEQQGNDWVRRVFNVRDGAFMMRRDIQGWDWVASSGGGAFRVGDTIAQYNHLNSTLREIDNGGGFVACRSLATVDDLFIGVSFRTDSFVPIAIADINNLDSPSGWTSLGLSDGITDNEIRSVDYFGGGLAVASGQVGVFYYLLGPDAFDKSDDRVRLFDRANNGLISNDVTVVKFSPEGELWAGTTLGLSRFTLDFGYFDPIALFFNVNLPSGFGPQITTIEFDSRSNAWVGSINGLVRIDRVDGDNTEFNTSNSGLLDNHINSLTIDPSNGDIYISTPKGISVILSNLANSTTDLDSVHAFPNPYVISSGDELLNFNFASRAELRIFTVAGELVVELPEPIWDGRNQSGAQVASGVYLFVLTDEDGNTGRGKFLLVRE